MISRIFGFFMSVLLLFSAEKSFAIDLIVHLNDGSSQSVSLSEIETICFNEADTSFSIQLQNNPDIIFRLTDIRKFTFDDLNQVSEKDSHLLSSLLTLKNYPNPFNNSTTISFELPTSGILDVTVYNIHGQKVKSLHKGFSNSGIQKIHWDGTTENGDFVGSGMYICRVKTTDLQLASRLIFIK